MRCKLHASLRSAIQLTLGSAASQILAVGFSLIYARLFVPEEMGLYALLLSVESMFGGVLSLRYETMMVTEPSERRALALCCACLCMTAVLGAVAAVGCGVVYHLVGGHSLSMILPMLLLLWLKGLIGVLESWNNRCGVYGLMASVTVERTLVQGLLSAGLCLLGMGAWGLLLGHLFGMMVGVRRQARALWQKRGELRHIGWRDMREVMHAYRRQALYATPSVFVNRFSYQLITLMLDVRFGSAVLGAYTMANKALSLPLTVLSGNVSRIFLREAGRAYHSRGAFREQFLRVSALMALLALVLGAAVWRLAPWGFRVLYGDQWMACSDMARAMVPMLMMRLVTSAVAGAMQITGKQRQELAGQVGMALVVLLAGTACASAVGMLWVVSVGFALLYGAVWCFAARSAGGASGKAGASS